MPNSIVDITSQRFRKLKVFIEHLKTHPVCLESSIHVEKAAVYKPLTAELKSVVLQTINNNLLHKYNEDYFSELKQDLVNYLNIDEFSSDNIFISLNLYNFYEYLTELFLQKDQKILLYTSSDFNFEQEAKYINAGRIVIEHVEPKVKDFNNINKELLSDDYKIVIVCAQDFSDIELRDFVDLLPENVVLVLRSSNPLALSYLNYGNKTVILIKEFPTIMTIVEPPICFAISRKEVINLFNQLQLPNHLDSITLFNAKYFTSLDNPSEYEISTPIRPTDGYEDILMSLVRENIELIKHKVTDYSLFNISQRLKMPIEEIVDFSSGYHFLGPAEDLKQSLVNFIDSEEGHNYYSQKTLLRNMISNKLSLLNKKFHYNNVLVGAGVSGLLESITRAFVNDGEGYKKLYKDKCVLLDFSPDIYTRVVEKRDARVEYVNLKPDLNNDLDELIDRIQLTKPKLILIDNPRILTGTYFDNTQLHKLLTHIPEQSIIVVDESLYNFAKAENADFVSAIEFIDEFPNLIILRSFSYINALAGMRLGYAIAQEHIINCIEAVRSPFDVSPYSIHMGIKIIEGNEIFEKVTLKYVQEQKEFLYQYLSELGLFYIKSATNSIVISTPLEAEELQERLLPYKIKIMPLQRNFVRISVNEQKQNIYLIKSLKMTLPR